MAEGLWGKWFDGSGEDLFGDWADGVYSGLILWADFLGDYGDRGVCNQPLAVVFSLCHVLGLLARLDFVGVVPLRAC